jgi:hypothetical protein
MPPVNLRLERSARCNSPHQKTRGGFLGILPLLCSSCYRGKLIAAREYRQNYCVGVALLADAVPADFGMLK